MKKIIFQICLIFTLGILLSMPSFSQNIIKKSKITIETNTKGVKTYNVNRKVLKNGENVLKTENGTVTFTLTNEKISNLKFTSLKGVVSIFTPLDKDNAFSCQGDVCGCSGKEDCQNMISFSGMKFAQCNCTTTFDSDGEITSRVCVCTMQ
ncbi:MAG TPA: hypothetical protein PLR98_13440 [Chitinophagaceae bacterium]|nr:hypothetical protein [Chitinophagaceae bacterium]HRF25171.1 hypothetical protein [Chitinophagaceae bacterium]